MFEHDQVKPVPGFDPKTKKQVLHTGANTLEELSVQKV
jgi:hypothetical protein